MGLTWRVSAAAYTPGRSGGRPKKTAPAKLGSSALSPSAKASPGGFADGARSGGSPLLFLPPGPLDRLDRYQHARAHLHARERPALPSPANRLGGDPQSARRLSLGHEVALGDLDAPAHEHAQGRELVLGPRGNVGSACDLVRRILAPDGGREGLVLQVLAAPVGGVLLRF